MSIRLTKNEIEAILAVAGAADAPAVVEDYENAAKGEAVLAHFESGMNKLRRRLAFYGTGAKDRA